jgi:hypothetical protein
MNFLGVGFRNRRDPKPAPHPRNPGNALPLAPARLPSSLPPCTALRSIPFCRPRPPPPPPITTPNAGPPSAPTSHAAGTPNASNGNAGSAAGRHGPPPPHSSPPPPSPPSLTAPTKPRTLPPSSSSRNHLPPPPLPHHHESRSARSPLAPLLILPRRAHRLRRPPMASARRPPIPARPALRLRRTLPLMAPPEPQPLPSRRRRSPRR